MSERGGGTVCSAPRAANGTAVVIIAPTLLGAALEELLWKMPEVCAARCVPEPRDAVETARRWSENGARVVCLVAAADGTSLDRVFTDGLHHFNEGPVVWVCGPTAVCTQDLTAARRSGVRVVTTWADHPAVLRHALCEALARRPFRSPALMPVAVTAISTAAAVSTKSAIKALGEGQRFATATVRPVAPVPPDDTNAAWPHENPALDEDACTCDEAGANSRNAPPSVNRRGRPAGALTHRQAEVGALAAIGLTNQEIGLRLGIAANTVKLHLQAVFVAYGISRREQLVSVWGCALEARR